MFAPYGILDTPPEPGFDDAVALARDLCATPVALVSLVTDERQWFKARAGFPDPQTDLDSSVCRFVVETGDLLVIPDLGADPRTAANPLVAGGPQVRFYAGAPLAMPDGAVLGALCVLDTVPRPEGLTDTQRRQLLALARQVSQQLELRRALREREAAVLARDEVDARRRLDDRRWRALFEVMNEGFIVGSLVRDEAGRVVDWRYDEVNEAWGELVGIDHLAAPGRTIRELFPDIEDQWVQEPARAIEQGETMKFTRQVGTTDRWYDGFMQPTGGDAFLVLFVEVTERIRTQRRLDALMEVADGIRECGTAGEMTSTTAAIVGRVLGASRAGYGRVDDDTRTVVIEPDWTAEGVASIAGKHRFEDFGRIRDELARAEPLVIEDVDTDPRTADDPGPMRALGIGALVNMPVRERGRTVAVFIVQSPGPRVWTTGELDFIRNVADRLEAGIARLRAEAQQEVINGEIAHRLKNTLAVVSAIATQTLRRQLDPEALQAFLRRLQTLGAAHDALFERNWDGAELGAIIRRTLASAGVEGQVRLAGPPVAIGPRSTLSTSLLIHELATNAIKHGALGAGGEVEVGWACGPAGAGEQLTLHWIERGGPPAAEPARRGFGSRLLSLGLAGTGGATIEFDRSGLRASFQALLSEVTQA